jgi:hypothetical protein
MRSVTARLLVPEADFAKRAHTSRRTDTRSAVSSLSRRSNLTLRRPADVPTRHVPLRYVTAGTRRTVETPKNPVPSSALSLHDHDTSPVIRDHRIDYYLLRTTVYHNHEHILSLLLLSSLSV